MSKDVKKLRAPTTLSQHRLKMEEWNCAETFSFYSRRSGSPSTSSVSKGHLLPFLSLYGARVMTWLASGKLA